MECKEVRLVHGEITHLPYLIGKISFCQDLDLSDKTLLATSRSGIIFKAVRTAS